MAPMDDTITNKLRDLRDDVERRDPVAFRMHLHELARRGLYDDGLDVMSRKWRLTQLDEAASIPSNFNAVYVFP